MVPLSKYSLPDAVMTSPYMFTENLSWLTKKDLVVVVRGVVLDAIGACAHDRLDFVLEDEACLEVSFTAGATSKHNSLSAASEHAVCVGVSANESASVLSVALRKCHVLSVRRQFRLP